MSKPGLRGAPLQIFLGRLVALYDWVDFIMCCIRGLRAVTRSLNICSCVQESVDFVAAKA